MAKYIDLDAVTGIIYSVCGECKAVCEDFDGFEPDCNECPLNCARKQILNLPAADVEEWPRWISVVDRLPDEWKAVITYQPSIATPWDGLMRVGVYIGNGKWRECEHHELMETPVTHWMPRPPKPPAQ